MLWAKWVLILNREFNFALKSALGELQRVVKAEFAKVEDVAIKAINQIQLIQIQSQLKDDEQTE